MNLAYLFEIQAGLDAHIMDEHPELKDQDNLDWKILALQVELGECANEWRGFKKWSNDQEPRTEIVCQACNGNQFFVTGEEIEPGMPYYEPCLYCYGTGIEARPLLEEYVDCLHFILSIGLESQFTHLIFDSVVDQENDITVQFNELFNKIGDFYRYRTTGNFLAIKSLFIGLGEMLGFTWEQVEQAYLEKNKVNHERQNNGY